MCESQPWAADMEQHDENWPSAPHTASKSCTASVTSGRGRRNSGSTSFLSEEILLQAERNQSFAFTPSWSLECIHGNPHPSEIPACIYTLPLHSTNTQQNWEHWSVGSIHLLLLQLQKCTRRQKSSPHLLFNPNSSSMQLEFLGYSVLWQQCFLSCTRRMSPAGFSTVWMHCWAPFTNAWLIQKLLIISKRVKIILLCQ